ncbi:MAG TPA: hypothetical protein EYG13_01350 [Dehalococcoidia bacterium]|nr:hypothetical protein [Dehalococcoidia bacterium]
MNAEYFHALYQELIEENPFAVRAVLKVLQVEFTETVPTLAVTCETRPRLLVNLAFLRRHCRTDQHVKAVICHEFLHVLLRHTERIAAFSPAEHVAFDAVINAIIHRELGDDYSEFMSRYYAKEKGVRRLLRPPTHTERTPDFGSRSPLMRAWVSLYNGLLIADDIADLARDVLDVKTVPSTGTVLIGGHDQTEFVGELPEVLQEALDQALKSMNGSGIWRSPNGRGVGANAYRAAIPGVSEGLQRWRRETLEVLRRHLLPDPKAVRRDTRPLHFTVPVLSPGDRRATLRALWSPLLPEALWSTEQRLRSGTAQVYLDVSGSMNAEMPLIIGLLARLGSFIRKPLWAFSDVVAKAKIVNGRLLADTTGGTSMACVLEHIAETRPAAAVVVTDGYIETLSPGLLTGVRGTRLHVIVTRDGSPAMLHQAGISYSQLSRLPT